MGAKIKPATPLPWKADRDAVKDSGNNRVCRLSVEAVAFSEGGKRQNAAYIVHAANAYPQLVDALRYIARGYSGYLGNSEGHSGAHCADKASEVLRSLGEAE